MPRKKRANLKRNVLPDPKYGSVLVSKLVNNVMLHGKKTLAQRIVYNAFDIVEEKTKRPGIEVFEESIEALKPALEVKARRVGGATYQVPMEVSADRAQTLALRWLVGYARKRNEKGMEQKLAAEMVDILNQNGGAFRKKEEMHKMAEANKAFAHYRY